MSERALVPPVSGAADAGPDGAADHALAIRRVVTGTSPHGEPHIVSDGPPPRSRAHLAIPGMVNSVVWATSAPPQPQHRDLTPYLVTVVPAAGEAVALVVTFPPDSVFADPLFDPAEAAREQREITPGLAELFEPDDPGFHTTPTVDYGVVLSGEIVLDLGSDTTVLRQGDIIVQNGTRHAWRNRTDQPATVFFVLLGTKPS
jgi:mannose-6-phosphate isomerase-like protein (cupin superfamily)